MECGRLRSDAATPERFRGARRPRSRFAAPACLAAACALLFGSVANAQVIDTPGKVAPRITDAGDSTGICARTSQVREAILALIDDDTDCADVTNTHLRGITGTLDLSSENITALHAGDFAGLSSVTLLDLYDNALTTLPSGLLTGLSSLEILYLDDNALTALPVDLMDPVPSLTELWARNNALTEFPPGFFAGKPELIELQIYHNPGDPDLKALDPIWYHRGNPLGVYVHLQALGDGRFKILVPVGTAFETVVSLEVTNGILADETITLPAGKVESDVLTVARESGTSSSVTVDIVDVRASDPDPRYPGKVTPMLHNGVAINEAGDLPVTVHPARKSEVRIAPRGDATSVTEGTAATFTLTRDLPHDGALTVTVDVSQTGEVIKSVGAYRAPGSVEFPAGDGTATLTVETQADTLDEPRGTITATVTAAASDPYTAGAPAAADVAVDDDDETTATVAAVSLSSDPPTAGVYAVGDTVRATVSFSVGHSGPVTVSGRPQLALSLGSARRSATYESGSGSTTLVFAYTVTEGDAAAGGIAFAADSLSLDGGAIGNAGGGADLAHAALAADPAHVVDGVRPALTGAATSEDGTSVVLTYAEPLDPANPPAKSAFAVMMNGADAALGGAPSVSGTDVTLPLTVPLRHGAPVTVRYTDPSTADDAAAVQDRYGNDAASGAVTVTNNVPETAGPYVDLVLDPASVTEDGGVSTVTATLTGPAPAAFTVTVTATAASPALAEDFSLSENVTLSFAAGGSASTGTVLITAVDNDARADDKTVRVSGRVADGSGVEPPPDRTLTIRDDEPAFVAVCDRTAGVRDALVEEAGAGTCDQVTGADLDGIESFDLGGAGITSLREGDFSGLTQVETITLVSNQLGTLPAGIFHGLSRLDTIFLQRNPSLSLPPGIFAGLTGLDELRLHWHQLPVGLKRVAPGRFAATIATGAPFDLVVRVSVTNGALSGGASSLTIPAGSIESGAVAVARTAPGAVEVDIAGFPVLPIGHFWYTFVEADGLPLEVIEAEASNTVPTITTSSPIVVAENGTAVAALEASDPDAGHVFTWTKTGGADADRFELSPGGILRFVAAPDYETPADLAGTDPPSPAGDNEYVVTVEVADGQGGRASKALVVSVTDEDEHETALQLAAWHPAVAPTDLAATTTDASVSVSWVVPAQPAEVYVSDMFLERVDAEGSVLHSMEVYLDLDTSEASSWSHTDKAGLATGTEYSYVVRMETSAHGDVVSEQVTATTRTDPPAGPEALSATVDDEGGMVLSWTVPDQPAWLGDTALMMVRRPFGHRLADVYWQRGTSTYSFTDTTARRGYMYPYTVTLHAAGRSFVSNTVEAMVPPQVESGPGPLAGFSLIDASDQTLIESLDDGDDITLEDPATGSFAIRADIAAGRTVGSVRLELSGPTTAGPTTESWAPYSMWRDDGPDALRGAALLPGDYTLTATATSMRYHRGDVLGTLEINFTITSASL